MLAAHLDPLPASLFSLLAIGSLLLSFVMLGSRWLRHYLYAFAAQSWLIAALSAAVGPSRPDVHDGLPVEIHGQRAAAETAGGEHAGKAANDASEV